MNDIIAIILGGGQGTRLYPLTQHRSKPAVPLAGKFRLIDIPISNCINSGIVRIFVLTQFNSESLNRHIAQTYHFDMFSHGFVDILAAEQTFDSRDWFQGTADAVRKCFRHFEAYHTAHILILSGDQLYQMDYREFFDFHMKRGADVSVATIPVTEEQAPEFGVMQVYPSFKIKHFIEKPSVEAAKKLCVDPEDIPDMPDKMRSVLRQRPVLASMGIYLFKTRVLSDLVKNREFNDFGKNIIPYAIKNLNVYSYLFDGYWSDIGTIKSFFMANLAMTRANPDFDLYNARFPIYTHGRFLPLSRIFQCRIHGSIVAEGCILNGALVWNSIVGIRSRIGEGTEVRESLIMGADFYEDAEALNENRFLDRPDVGVGNFCTIKRAIIDKNCRIGNNVQILNTGNIQHHDGEHHVIRDGIVIIPKNAVVPDNTVI